MEIKQTKKNFWQLTIKLWVQIINLKIKCFTAWKILKKGVDLYLIHGMGSCIMNDQWILSLKQCHTTTIMVHQKCKPNCFALNEIQKPHFNSVRVVVQTEKKLYSQS